MTKNSQLPGLIPNQLLSIIEKGDCVLFLGADLPLGYKSAPLSRPELAAAMAEKFGLPPGLSCDTEIGRQGDKERKRKYPWGDKFDQNKCNTSESSIGGTTSMGKYSPEGDSPYGCADMARNVREWTSSLQELFLPGR